MNYKKGFTYTGSKYKLLPQIIPIIEKEINAETTFFDCFCGGLNVGLNINNTENKIFNDVCTPLINMYKEIFRMDCGKLIERIYYCMVSFNMNKFNEEAYKDLRMEYNNEDNRNIWLLILIYHSFNNMIRFNKHGKFNLPFGNRTFNQKAQENLEQMHKEFHKDTVKFTSLSFSIDFIENLTKSNLLNKDCFFYIDPPYINTDTTYNKNWTIENEKELYKVCDIINENKAKFALSNCLVIKDKENDLLKEFSKKYNIHYLNVDYSNSNHQRKNYDDSIEVLITNY